MTIIYLYSAMAVINVAELMQKLTGKLINLSKYFLARAKLLDV
jgi:hypothetical protein